MEPLSPGASLPHIQDYVRNMEIERGLDRQDLTSQCLKLGEEVGELYRAVRKLQGQPQDPSGRIADIGDEAADTLILLMSIINRCGVNMEKRSGPRKPGTKPASGSSSQRSGARPQLTARHDVGIGLPPVADAVSSPSLWQILSSTASSLMVFRSSQRP